MKWRIDSYVDWFGVRKWRLWDPRGHLDGLFLDPKNAFARLRRRLDSGEAS